MYAFEVNPTLDHATLTTILFFYSWSSDVVGNVNWNRMDFLITGKKITGQTLHQIKIQVYS